MRALFGAPRSHASFSHIVVLLNDHDHTFIRHLMPVSSSSLSFSWLCIQTGDNVEAQQLQMRVEALKDSACLSLFLGISQGLFPRHKLIFSAELCFRGLIESGSLHPALVAFLVRPQATDPDMESPFKEWLGARQWQSVVELSQLEIPGGEDDQGNTVSDLPFEGLQNEMLESSRRFRD